MNKIVIKKEKKDKNNRIFYFKYIGKSQNDINDDVLKRINKFLNHKKHSNMLKNVQVLRTLLKENEELELEIVYKDEKKYEIVNYNKGKLILYEIIDRKRNFDFTDHYIRGIIFKSKKQNREIYNEMLDYVEQLQEVSELSLTLDQEKLIEIYKLFYDEIPNFMDHNINIKIQTMMIILASYGINLNNEYSFSCTGENKIPLSFYLQSIIQDLTLYNNFNTSIKLNPKTIEIIKTVGKVIREKMTDNDKTQNLQTLIYISKIIYANRYEMPINENQREIDEISKYSGCSREEIETAIGISRKINKKLYD